MPIRCPRRAAARPRLRERLSHMPKYIIERDIAGAGDLSQDQLRAISQKSCSVLSKLGPQIQWVQSYVTDDKIYCVYNSINEELVRQHAVKGGFPVNSVVEVSAIIDPVTAGDF